MWSFELVPPLTVERADGRLCRGHAHVFYIFPTDRNRHVRVLKELIEDHGGQVVDYHDKPPEDVALKHAEGYALIDPSQRHAPDFLKLKSRKSKNGEIVLWYINWGFPHLCIEIQDIPDLDLAREVLVFTQKISKNGGWAIYLSSTLGLDEAKRTKVESRIMRHGGVMVDNATNATIVIVSDDPEVLERKQLRYWNNPKTRVESYSWLMKTYKKRKYVRFSISPEDAPMPGRPPISQGGLRRVAYTAEDDDHLVEYLAFHGAPTREGLRGRDIYKELCANPDRWPWGSRHTAESWLSHYRANASKLDQRIAMLFQDEVPFRDKHGQDVRTRSANRKPVKLRDESLRQTPIQSGSVEPEDPKAKGSEQGVEETPSIRAQAAPPRKPEAHHERKEREAVQQEDPVVDGNDADYHTADEAPLMEINETFEDLSAMPKSTPPRREHSYSTQRTLVNDSSIVRSSRDTVRSALSRKRNIFDVSSYNDAFQGIYGIPMDADSEPEDTRNPEEQVEGVGMDEAVDRPHLNMIEQRRKTKPKSGGSTRAVTEQKSSPDSETDEEKQGDSDEMPARSFHLSGSVRRPVRVLSV